MRIHIDASRALDERPTGVNVYAQEIIDHLIAADPDDEFVLYAPHWLRPRVSVVFPQMDGSRAQWKFLNWPPKFLWTQLCLAWAWSIADKTNAVFFAPAHVAPFFSPRNLVVTIHDVAFEMLPDAFSKYERLFARFMTRMNASAARAIIVPSEETRQQLITRYKIPAEKITVTHFALPCFVQTRASDADAQRVKEKYKLTKPFVLSIGRIEYKKGADIAVRAIEAIRSQGQHVELVLVGKPGIGYDAIKNQIDGSEDRDHIHELGFVDARDIPALYRAATVFALPTRYEGFGFNFLEAMHQGAPVVGMANGSVPEIAGDAAALAKTEVEFQELLVSVLIDSALRQQLVQRGFERMKAFDWKQTAAQTLDILMK